MTTYAWDRAWTSPQLDGTGEQIAIWAADTLAEAAIHGDALHVSTPDAGAREALAFWAAAQQTGLAFAAPGAFPWTLANSPTGAISQRLQITGPCTTHVGADEAVAAAFEAAGDALADGLVARAVVVWLRGDRPVGASGGPVRVRLAVRVLTAAAADRRRTKID
jgi:hypothetical protein